MSSRLTSGSGKVRNHFLQLCHFRKVKWLVEKELGNAIIQRNCCKDDLKIMNGCDDLLAFTTKYLNLDCFLILRTSKVNTKRWVYSWSSSLSDLANFAFWVLEFIGGLCSLCADVSIIGKGYKSVAIIYLV
ncbi:hypothetical protein L2E82_15222 [Cichorium intybus]|uniref:Uncharacterized protein n=1 Tax=Cichorium intybus TaxID=13427 RepID=A0ACB9F1T9_CICIN|nr:hypothetical protein L2E82_15222 [Cichorium intybus]